MNGHFNRPHSLCISLGGPLLLPGCLQAWSWWLMLEKASADPLLWPMMQKLLSGQPSALCARQNGSSVFKRKNSLGPAHGADQPFPALESYFICALWNNVISYDIMQIPQSLVQSNSIAVEGITRSIFEDYSINSFKILLFFPILFA